jgi:tRNA pseudouridine13 synthase
MASVRSHDDPPIDAPRKRQKLSPGASPSHPDTSTQPVPPDGKPVAAMDEPLVTMALSETGFQPERETECAILHFVNASNPGFTGVLKQRYVPHSLHTLSILHSNVLDWSIVSTFS